MRKWILFRRRNHNVHYLWNGHYPVLITAHADLPAMTGLDLPQWGWSHRHRNIDEESWKTLSNSWRLLVNVPSNLMVWIILLKSGAHSKNLKLITMSEQNEKLTAEQKAETLLTSFLNNVYKDTPKNLQPDFVYIHDSAVRKLMKTLMLMFYAQQVEHATDELRKELEVAKCAATEWFDAKKELKDVLTFLKTVTSLQDWELSDQVFLHINSIERVLAPKTVVKPTWECYEYHRANMPAYGCTQQCAECAEEQSKKSKSQ